MSALNFETADFIRILIIGIILFAALGMLKLAFNLTRRILMLGCLGIIFLLGAMLVFAFFP